MEVSTRQLDSPVAGPTTSSFPPSAPTAGPVVGPVRLNDWEINLALDDSGNLLLDVVRAGIQVRKVFYCNGKCDIRPIPTEETMEEVWGKVGDGKRKREEDNVESIQPHKKTKGITESPKFFCFMDLPPELQIRIFEFLPPRDVLSNVGRVCKDWSSLLTEDSLWHTLHVLHFGRNQRQGKTWRAQCKEVMQRIMRQETRTQRKLFFWAARYGYVELVRSNLKQCPALINRRNKWGIPALCKAAKKGHTDIVELLLQHPDANVNIETDLHTTALCMVADKGNVEMAKLLIAHGADVNIADNNGRTPLRRAASKGFKRTVQLLATNGADVNMADIFGRTALFRAASKGVTSMVKLLLSLGADVTIQDAEGRTPLYMACKMGHKETAGVIRTAMERAEAEKRRQQELERRAQGQIDLPPLSPSLPSDITSSFTPRAMSTTTTTYAPLSRSRSAIMSPTSSPTSSPPGSPSPLPATIPYLTRPVPIPMAIVNPNNHNHNHPHPHPHPLPGHTENAPAGYTIPSTFNSPYLFINPTTKATFMPVPSTSTSPPRASTSSSLTTHSLVPVRLPPSVPPMTSSYLAPSSAFASLSSAVQRVPPTASSFIHSSPSVVPSSVLPTTTTSSPHPSTSSSSLLPSTTSSSSGLPTAAARQSPPSWPGKQQGK